MADTKRSNESPSRARKTGKSEYNPVNMAGKKAGIIKEYEKQTAEESGEREGGADDKNTRRQQNQPRK